MFAKIKEFENIEKEVDALIQENSGRFLYLTFDYLISWLHAFAKDDKLQILIAEKNEKIIGLCPMVLQTVKWKNIIPLRVMKFIGAGLWGYTDFLIAKEFHNEVIEVFLNFLLKERRAWDRLEIGPISEDSLNIDGIRGHLRKINKKRWLIMEETWFEDAPYVRINEDFGIYRKERLSRKLVYDIERCIRRLKKLGTLEYGKLTECSQFPYLDSYLEKFFLLHQKEWKDSRFLRIPQYKNLYRELAARALQKGFFEFSYLCLNQNMLACHYGFVLNQILYYFTPARNIDFDKYAPGKVLLYYIMEDAFTRGIKEFDFQNGREAYKLRWASDLRKRYYFKVYKLKVMWLAICDRIIMQVVKLLEIIVKKRKIPQN